MGKYCRIFKLHAPHVWEVYFDHACKLNAITLHVHDYIGSFLFAFTTHQRSMHQNRFQNLHEIICAYKAHWSLIPFYAFVYDGRLWNLGWTFKNTYSKKNHISYHYITCMKWALFHFIFLELFHFMPKSFKESIQLFKSMADTFDLCQFLYWIRLVISIGCCAQFWSI